MANHQKTLLSSDFQGNDMNEFIKNNWGKINVTFYAFVFASILMTASALLNRTDSHPWATADWLINYQGGFVRRGLIGEIILKISSLTNIGLIPLVTFLQVSLYLCILIFTYKLTKEIKPTILNSLIIFSPAFTLFPVNDPPGGFKKEILLFALLSFHSYYLSNIKRPPSNNYLVLLALSFVFIVMSHEVMAAFLPYFICGLYIQNKKLDRSHLIKYALVLAPSIIVSMLIMLFFKGNAEIVADICSSLLKSAPPDCQTSKQFIDGQLNIGSISFLAKSFDYSYKAMGYSNPPRGLMTNVIAFFLAITPVLYLFKKNEASKPTVQLLIFPLISFLASLPLLLIFADYGRLICIHATCLTFVALQMLNTHRDKDIQGNGASAYAWCLCLVFIFGWRVIHNHAMPGSEFTPLRIYKSFEHASIPSAIGQHLDAEGDLTTQA